MTKSEAQTRQQIIDQRLKLSGWDVKNPSYVTEELDIWIGLPSGIAEPRTPYQGHLFADYVLLGKDGRPLAVVEAKKSSVDAEIGKEQEPEITPSRSAAQAALPCRLFFIPTVMTSIFGILNDTRLEKFLASLPDQTLIACNSCAITLNLFPDFINGTPKSTLLNNVVKQLLIGIHFQNDFFRI